MLVRYLVQLPHPFVGGDKKLSPAVLLNANLAPSCSHAGPIWSCLAWGLLNVSCHRLIGEVAGVKYKALDYHWVVLIPCFCVPCCCWWFLYKGVMIGVDEAKSGVTIKCASLQLEFHFLKCCQIGPKELV